MKNRNRFLIPAVAWLITCTIMLTLPASAFPSEKWYMKIPMFDKWAHIGIFCILSFLFCWGIFKSGIFTDSLKRNFVQIGISCLLYGIVMELIQRYFIPNRSFDTGDVIADGVGSLAGVFYSFKAYIKK
ncbi:MAG TPA: VanZ family protein [Chitinophagaceae bacterium]|nr:VanZ family protein [Chitinophagaceae bacterium]